ncbi:MAG TPA: cytochrome c [Candidatus Acidoferrum sp.]|nr:cytochrome c [Candidatus Acidoferrum sp.]
MPKIPILLTAALLLSALGLYSKTQGPPQPTPEERAAVDRGRLQFQQACGFCHGPDATGARGPDLVRSPLVAHDVKGNLIGEVIRNGRPDKGMPALPLSAEQIGDIAAFLHARAREAVESSGVPSDYPFEKLLTGNAEKGKAFFEGAGGCSKCHQPTGDLAGIAKKYNAIELEAHMLYPEQKPVLATVTLPGGEQLSGTVTHLDDFTVGIRIGGKNGWYRSFARSKVKVKLEDPLEAHRELLPKISQVQMHDLFRYLYSLQ